MKLSEVRDTIECIYGAPSEIISDCIRGFLTAAPGKKLIACDFSAIEARVLAWLAGEEKTLDVFRSHGKIYEHTASQIYNVDIPKVTKDQRLIGKVATLALGFQGGIGAFQSMAKVYFVKVPDEMAEKIKIKWRKENEKIVQYWWDLEEAAMQAVDKPGERFSVGAQGRPVTFLMKGSFLLCRLPSSRVISYPYPRIVETSFKWIKIVKGKKIQRVMKKNCVSYMSEVSGQAKRIPDELVGLTEVYTSNRWRRIPAYGGLFAENVTQATARDLLRDAMFRWEKNGYEIVMHVHDEIVAEVYDTGMNAFSLERAEKLMCRPPDWASGLPIKVEGWEGKRYRK